MAPGQTFFLPYVEIEPGTSCVQSRGSATRLLSIPKIWTFVDGIRVPVVRPARASASATKHNRVALTLIDLRLGIHFLWVR